MPRIIDTLPVPDHVCEKKLIVTAKSRTGTFSLYQALKMLGFRPYHMYEVVHGGPKHMAILEDAVKAKYFGIGKTYGKAEFDKWFAEYDTIIEVTPVLLDDLVTCYPDAQFMHMERDVEAWYRSMDNTGGPMFAACDKFPLKQMRLIDSFVDKFCSLHLTLESFWTEGKPWPEGKDVCVREYLNTNKRVRELIPADNLAIFKLEDGFGWDGICPYLKKPIPETPYPRGNAPAEFKKLADEVLSPAFRRAAVFVATSVLAPVISAGLWYYTSSN
ncbi:hypothetical protein SUNI508_05491 [Seiridium unicorne]|uniref:P-loop containing nucleoside triphosphate hydrolase protein n=1 Tax=Seiridium unicorne TaxID=138068 RepID=A0ABR2V3Y1_9PEZI